MTKKEVQEICQIIQNRFPDLKPELDYENNFQLLCAVVLSAQATDVSVNKATAPLFIKVKTPQDMVDLGYDKLAQAIKTIGLWRAKAKHLIALSEDLITQHNSEVPDTREALMRLAGVGRKTANVVLNVAFGQQTIAVDTHIFRVSNRLGLASGRTPDAVEKQLLRVIPRTYQKDIHLALIMWGRYICLARRPQCPTCQLAVYCRFARHSL